MAALVFAFTDIEGSTARWERTRAAMEDAVRRHDAVMRDAIERYGGKVFKTVGDAFCAVFAQPADAVGAMVEAQQRLIAEDFSAVDGLAVRAAIHVGAAHERDGDYFGPAVNKVARLMAIGHGGQILLTAEAAELLAPSFDTWALRDLGAYHLKDFVEPQRVVQIVASGLPAEFPPLRSLGTLPSDLSIVDAGEFRSIPGFSGRDAELAAVHAALAHDGAIAVVHGLGGVGKSSIAREYGWRNRERYSVIWWLNAQSEDGFIDGLLRLGAMFVQGLDQLADRRAAAQRVINSVLGGFDKPVLLVFDNLEEERVFRPWLPRTGARALLTSRGTAWGSDISAIPLSVWSLDTAVQYLLRETERTDLTESDALTIATALGSLPLALAHAAALLRRTRMVTPRRYLDRVNEYLKKAPGDVEYPHSVFATFSTAIAQAEQEVEGATATLGFAASFAPDAIPDELFRQRAEVYPAELRAAIADDVRLDDALGTLDRLSLLSFSPAARTYSIHRLVQLAVRDSIADSGAGWNECVVAVAEAAFPQVDFAVWSQCERLLPHARAALQRLPSDTAFLAAGRLAGRCAVYLRERAEFTAGEELQKRALTILQTALGPSHPEVATSLDELAILCYRQARHKEAEPLQMRALAIREDALGPEHPDVASSLNDIAIVYLEQGRYDEAEPLHKRALAIREKAFGPGDAKVASALNNLAIVYCEQGKYTEGEPLLARSLRIREEALGPNHPHVATSLNNLGNLYESQGRFEEAAPVFVRAIGIWEESLGPEHPDLSLGLNSLGNIYGRQGRYAEAEALIVRALAIREKAYGPDNPPVAVSLDTLASLYDAQGRSEEAERLRSRANAIRRTTAWAR